MSNENLNVEAVEVEAKPKRVRKPVVKVQKTAVEIIHEIETLTNEVAELESAVTGLANDSIAYDIVSEAHDAKKAELDKALNQVYTA
jgi:hypothetical protein